MCGSEIEWLEPWQPVSEAERQTLEAELGRELTQGHLLFGQPVTIIGRRIDQDDVLCSLSRSGRVAIVHLTWRVAPETDPQWRTVQMFDDIDSWIAACMKTDHPYLTQPG